MRPSISARRPRRSGVTLAATGCRLRCRNLHALWALDAEDSLALPLAAAKTRLPLVITETPERFAIEWAGTFRIEGELMIFAAKAGRPRTIIGYPTREIAAALARARP